VWLKAKQKPHYSIVQTLERQKNEYVSNKIKTDKTMSETLYPFGLNNNYVCYSLSSLANKQIHQDVKMETND